MQTQLQRSKHDPSETRCKLTLLILFLLGAALILGGFWGIRQYQQSGFDQEVGYRYIQKLSGEVESLYTQSIQPVMARLTDAEREALTLEAAALLKENWTAAVKADQSARADEMLAGLEGDKLQQKTMELLSITYSLNGPKVASAEKKLLAQWTDAERDQNREALLRAVLDENAPVPQAVASAVGELTGSERAAALMQLFLVSAMSQIHVSLEECSQISGASWTRTMLKITGPLIFPSIAAGWFLIFIPSFYELSMTTLLYSNSTKTIGFQLYEYWTFTSQPQSCAMAFGILMIVVVLNFLLNKLTKGEFSI